MQQFDFRGDGGTNEDFGGVLRAQQLAEGGKAVSNRRGANSLFRGGTYCIAPLFEFKYFSLNA